MREIFTMDSEKLQLANTLESNIKTAQKILDHWKGATSLGNSSCYLNMTLNNRTCTDWVNASPETFLVVKALNVDYWQRKLDEYKEQFDSL